MTDQVSWPSPPAELRLGENEVHIWKAHLDLAPASIPKLFEVLNDAERNRAERFVFDKDRTRFVVARSILRLLVAQYLNTSARTIEFSYGPQGKPSLRENSHLRFNLAHSGGLALYAFSLDRELGIDLESERRFSNTENKEIVQTHFSREEQSEFYSLEPKLQDEAFYLGWTRKEAYLKARGEGLQIPLQSFDVSLTPEGPVTLRSDDAVRWAIQSFCPEPNFVAALVVERGNCRLRYWEWPRNFAI
jgi:4'-phosphopantetheinyl transferase